MSVLPRRFLRHFLYAILSLAALTPPGQAQTDACDLGPGCLNDLEAPVVSLSPGSGTRGRATVTLVVSWSDDTGVPAAYRHVWVNGREEALTGWTASGDSLAGTLTKTLALLPGNNTIVALVCDRVPTCSDATVSLVHEPSYGVEVTPDAVVVGGGAKVSHLAVEMSHLRF